MNTKLQQEFLRETATSLGLTQKQLAVRMGAPWKTFAKWLLPTESLSNREMPEIVWQLGREILAHEALKAKHQKLKKQIEKTKG